MNKIFNLTSTFKSHTEDDGSVKIRGMASTNEFDRAGDSILPDAWKKGGLKNFEKNPIYLGEEKQFLPWEAESDFQTKNTFK